jgi:hypothetical protein
VRGHAVVKHGIPLPSRLLKCRLHAPGNQNIRLSNRWPAWVSGISPDVRELLNSNSPDAEQAIEFY